MKLALTIDGNTWGSLFAQNELQIVKSLSGTFSTANFTLIINDVKDATVLPDNYSEVIMTNSDTSVKAFRGVITTITITQLSGNTQSWACQCSGLEYLLQNAIYTNTWTNVTDRKIIQDTFGAVLSEIATTSATVAIVGTGLNFTATDLTVQEILNNLCQLTGAEYRIDEDKNLIYRLEGSDLAPAGFSDNPTE